MRELQSLIPLVVASLIFSGCSGEEQWHPLTGLVAVSVPELHYPVNSKHVVRPAPVIELQSVEMFPTPCYRLTYSKSEQRAGIAVIHLGDGVSDAVLCHQVLAPARVVVPLDSASDRYRLTLTLRESVDTYLIEIEHDLTRLIPIELHFTIPADSVWMR